MRILVAEDEIRARNAIVQIISKNRPQCEVTGVGDGDEAMKLIHAGEYGLLLTDIKMPHMDGLTLLENVKKLSPGTAVVIVSAYSYFAYAQKALKAGAYDYLLKPFSNSALLGVIDEIAAEKPGPGCPPPEPEETGRALLFFPLAGRECPAEGWQSLESDIRDLLKKEPAIHTVRSSASPDSLNLYLSTKKADSSWVGGFKSRLTAFLGERGARGAGFTASVGPERPMKDISHSVANAHYNADLAYYRDAPAVFIAEEVFRTEPSFFITEPHACLLAAVQSCDPRLAGESLAQAVDGMKRCGLPPAECKSILTGWAEELMILHGTAMLGETRGKLERDARGIADSAHYRETLRVTTGIVEEICGAVSSLRGNKTALLMEKSMEYIAGHYHEPDMSLTKIAESFHFNPAYYSSLFKKNTGLSVSQYLLNLRIFKAKELLLTSSDKIYEIAGRVGFYDDKYFIRVFVKETGITPGAFRVAGYEGAS